MIWVSTYQCNKTTNSLQNLPHFVCTPQNYGGGTLGFFGDIFCLVGFVFCLGLKTVSVSLRKQGEVNLTFPGLPCNMKAKQSYTLQQVTTSQGTETAC